jgi:hypothetical protein
MAARAGTLSSARDSIANLDSTCSAASGSSEQGGSASGFMKYFELEMARPSLGADVIALQPCSVASGKE